MVPGVMHLRACLVLVLALANTAISQKSNAAADPLSLDGYLHQVAQGHTGLQGALEIRDGATARSRDARIALAPALLTNIQLSKNDAYQPLFGVNHQVQNTYSLGVSQLTTFGLEARLTYGLS